MRTHRFIIDTHLDQNTVEVRDKDVIHQICNVLRLKVGDQIIVSDGNMTETLCAVDAIDKNMISCSILEKWRNINEPDTNVTLYCSLLKRENFDLVVQKSVEAGVSALVPIMCDRTVKLGVNRQRMERIIKEAAEQSGRGVVPHLHDPIKFQDALTSLLSHDSSVVFDDSGDLSISLISADDIGAMIGPEGGWSKEELASIVGSGVSIVSLGGLTLRAETAAIVSTFLLSSGVCSKP